MLKDVPVGPFQVLDASRAEVVRTAVDRVVQRPAPQVVAYALHVGGLNHRDDPDYVAAMADADLVYADGGAVVALARLVGAHAIERAPTTDVGWDILHDLRESLGRLPRLALVGGPPHLAERAGGALEAGLGGSVVAVTHGYHKDWAPVLQTIRSANPDVTIVGLGAPREMLWVHRWRHELPPGLILTCGGWFGFLAGEERRAPSLLRRPGLEWIARVTQSPRRLLPRYALGLWSTLALVPASLAGRWKRRRYPR
jgi:N-acetylglucosaminyldiphosphoundecaprenol N-acetyl-beta-D-mannosaminyltransferase